MGAIGIYLNPAKQQAFRASTTHAAPDSSDWVLISEDSMIGMLQIRQLASERGLVEHPEQLHWIGRTDVPDPAAQA